MQMQNNVNTSPEFYRTQGILAARSAFSRLAMIVLTCASVALTVFFVLRMVIATVTSHPEPAFTSLYYFCGMGAVPAVNIVLELLIAAFLVPMTIGLIQITVGERTSDAAKVDKGLGLLKKSLIYALIISFLFVVVSLCSISVMYQADRIGKQNEFATVSGVSSGELFFQTIVFSTLAIAAFISFLHTIISTKRLYEGVGITTGGMLPATIVAFIGAFVFLITSFISLGNLVMPPSDGDTIQFSSVGSASADVIIHIALTTISLSFAMIVMGLNNSTHAILRTTAGTAYLHPSVQMTVSAAVPMSIPAVPPVMQPDAPADTAPAAPEPAAPAVTMPEVPAAPSSPDSTMPQA